MKNFSLDCDTPETIMPNGHLRVKAVDELIRLVILVGYIWVVCELLSVNKSIVLSKYHLSYAEYAFAIINSLVFAKVLLTRNCILDFVAKLFRQEPPSLWAGNTCPEWMPYLHYLSQETVVGSAHVHVVSAQGN